MRIAVVGAGPAGLTVAASVARAVAASAPSAESVVKSRLAALHVFEKDGADRDQGAGWDLDTAAQKVRTLLSCR